MSSMSEATAWAASAVQPPANTASRTNNRLVGSSRRSTLHWIAARNVR
jgi:hypothetical protein